MTDSAQPCGPLLPHGGYRQLRSYKVAELVYDATVVFCRRFFFLRELIHFCRTLLRSVCEEKTSMVL